MKKILKIIGIILLVIVVAIGAFALYINVDGIPKYPKLVKDPGITVKGDSAMLMNGERLASMLCVNCHLNAETNVLTGDFLPDQAGFGKIHSANITQDQTYGIGKWTD